MQKNRNEHVHGVPNTTKAKPSEDVLSHHHGVPSAVPSTCVGLVTLGSNFTCRQQSVGPCQTTPPHQPLAPCLLATAWVTAHGVQLYPAPCISQAATGLEWAAPAVVASTAVPPPGSRTVPRSLVCAQALSGRRLNGGTIAAKLPQLAAATARPSCLARSLARPPAPQSAARPLVAGSPVARSIVDR